MEWSVAPHPWPKSLGSHRVRIEVNEENCSIGPVAALVEWRRHDDAPESKGMLLAGPRAPEGPEFLQLSILSINSHALAATFVPEQGPGAYYLYYLPWHASEVPHEYKATYLPAHEQLPIANSSNGKSHPIESVAMESRTPFESFYPMEVAASKEEVDLLRRHFPTPIILFTESREYPIRMRRHLPVRWVESGPSTSHHGSCDKGEFYTFQVGVFASTHPVTVTNVEFHPLTCDNEGSPAFFSIPSDAMRCVNLAGKDWLGRSFTKEVQVPLGHVAPLWFGIDVPEEAPSARFCGMAYLVFEDGSMCELDIVLDVSDRLAIECGDGDPQSMTRLRWLDSTLGLEDEVTSPYIPLYEEAGRIYSLGNSIKPGRGGLPESFISSGRELLHGPMSVLVERASGDEEFAWDEVALGGLGVSYVEWSSSGTTLNAPHITMDCSAHMDYDGYVNFTLRLSADEACEAHDVALVVPLCREIAVYMMGLGCKGGARPASWAWSWDVSRANSSVWLGSVDAGLHIRLKDSLDSWCLYDFGESGLPKDWTSGLGGGGSTVTEVGEAVVFRAFTGHIVIEPGKPREFCFGILPTPVKPLDKRHWEHRYYHDYVPIPTVLSAGANIVNIHHGNQLNPNINYPFNTPNLMLDYVNDAHSQGVKVKLYYTVRELSDYAKEIWALRSLGDEVFSLGDGGGHTWLMEHLESDYKPCWHHVYPDGQVDASIGTTGLSRWHNYYLEGLAWLLRHVGIDGLYLDGIGYNREVMKRVRRILDSVKPGCLIDFHSGNNYHPQYGLSSCANQYIEHFPFIDSLWFGEGFDSDESPDYWLVEMSGIPFGLYGEMLEGGGNPYRGMLYGMTCRHYLGANPTPIWRLWDEFDIAGSEMIGYWDERCPVKTTHGDVLATSYVKETEILVVVASWAKEEVDVRLVWDEAKTPFLLAEASLRLPGVEGLQSSRGLGHALSDIVLAVKPGGGRFIVVESGK